MKIAYKHLVRNIFPKPDIQDISSKLLQLGHEHEIENDIFDEKDIFSHLKENAYKDYFFPTIFSKIDF